MSVKSSSYLLLRSFCQFPIIEMFYTRPTTSCCPGDFPVLFFKCQIWKLPSITPILLSLPLLWVLPMDPMVLDPRRGCLAQIQLLLTFPQGPSALQLYEMACQRLNLTPLFLPVQKLLWRTSCVSFSHCNSPITRASCSWNVT